MAELALTCPKCHGTVSVPIEGGARSFTCSLCGEVSLIEQSLDAFSQEFKDPLIGEVIADCRIEEKRGEGGFGAVYRALDLNLQRLVAVKVMHSSMSSNQELVQKFFREAVTAAQLNHPNIVAIHKFGRDEGKNLHYLMMEYLDCPTLAEVIDAEGVLPLDRAISVVVQCADALASAHDKMIVHRDIKPDNIMVDRRGVVKITDFGLAKVVTTDHKSTKLMGTPHFMSPEHLEGKAIDGRTDIYSLGVTFYYLLTKAKPYEGENTVQVIFAILTQDPRPLTEVNPEIPEEIWRIVRKMIAKKLEDRYPDFRAVKKDLLAFQERELSRKVTCPRCSAENPSGRKFCRECGASLRITCPECGAEELPGTRHCGKCGANIEGILKVKENLERARKLRDFGDLRRALAFYGEILKVSPENEEATQATVELRQDLDRIEKSKAEIDALVESGAAEQALSAIDHLLSVFPKSEEIRTWGDTVRRSLRLRAVDAHLLVAEKALAEGRLDDAVAAYRNAHTVDPDRADIGEKLEDLERRIKALDKTLEAAETALARGRHVDALNAAREILRLKPEHERARQIHDAAKAKVESVESFVTEANEFLDQKHYEEAIERLETALEISPGDEEVAARLDMARRGRAGIEEKLALIRRLLAEDRPEEALAGADDLLAERPDLAAAAALKEEAERDVEKSRREQEVTALLDQARALERRGRLDKALDVVRQALTIAPENAAAQTLEVSIEARREESGDLRKRADELLSDGAFAEAVPVLVRLAELLPSDEEIAARTEEAREKAATVDAALRRASEASKRHRFDVARKAAEEALAVAPGNATAQAAKREAERGLSTIEKHLSEARRLIESELFDDAISELDQAEEQGAPQEEVAKLRSAAEDGKVVLLKSEATRSFVFKDFESAIERYEQVLSVDAADSDAKKGIHFAEKMIRSRSREGVLGKVLAAVIVLAGLFTVQFVATSGHQAGSLKAKLPKAAPVKQRPAVESLVAMEKAAGVSLEGWRGIEGKYESYLKDFPEGVEFREGRRFASALSTALAKKEGTPKAHLSLLNAARSDAGNLDDLRTSRVAVVDRLIDRTTEAWFSSILESEGEDWAGAAKRYQEMLDDPDVTGKLRTRVEAARKFAAFLSSVPTALKSRNYGVAIDLYDQALKNLSGSGPLAKRRRNRIEKARKSAADEWIRSVFRELAARADDPDASPRQLADILDELATMVRELPMSTEELWKRLH